MESKQSVFGLLLLIITYKNCTIATVNTTDVAEERFSDALTKSLITSPQPEKDKMWTFEELLSRDFITYNTTKFKDQLDRFDNTFQRDIVSVQLRFCPYTKLCTVSSLLNDVRPLMSIPCCDDCSCDSTTCVRQNTCCPDIIDFGDVLHSKETKKTEAKITQSCVHMTLKASDSPVFAFAKCPKSSSLYTAKCDKTYTSDTDYLVDVVPCVSKVSKEIYRNRFCAYCNGLTDNDIEFFKPTLNCHHLPAFEDVSEDHKLINALFSDSRYMDCDIAFSPNSAIKLSYCRNSIDSCNTTGLWTNYSSVVETACLSYRSLIQYGKKNYQNIFCVICNGFYEKAFQTYCYVPDNFVGPPKPFAFSGIIYLEGGQMTEEAKLTSIENCSLQQLFDKQKMKCVPVFCPEYFFVKQDTCQFRFTPPLDITFRLILKLTPFSEATYNSRISRTIFRAVKRFVRKTGGYILFMKTTYFIHDIAQSYQRDDFIKYCEMDLYMQPIDDKYFDIILFELRNVHRAVVNTNTVIHSEFDTDGLFRVEVLSKSGLNTSNNTIVEVHGNKHAVKNKGRNQPLLISALKYPLSCPFVNISSREIKNKITTEQGLVLNEDFVIKQGQWYSDDYVFYICAIEYERYLNYSQETQSVENPYRDPEVIVSVVCSVVSILALMLTLMTYLVHSSLRRTLPGKNLVSLSGSLMVAQILYLTANFAGLQSSTYSCEAAGLFLHFFLLVAVFWMNVCTFHMFRVLTRTRAMSVSSGWKRFAMYLLYTVGCSIICVGINVLSSSQIYGHIGYGQLTCYISSQVLLYFTFGLPLAFVIISNVGMFLAVIVKIKRTGSVSKSVQNERNDIVVFAKLSTITGATWIFGFIYAWTNIVVFSYIFIVLNASQGLLLFFAFVANTRVLIMYKEMSTSRRGLDSSSCSQPTTSSTLASK